jgi:hypothetical protein
MDFGSVFVFLALLLLVGLYVSRPLFEKRSTALTPIEHQVSSLLAERDRVLDSIRELDMDYSMGKITPEDYRSQRAVMLQRGAEILRQLDGLMPEANLEVSESFPEAESVPQPAGLAQPSSLAVSSRDFNYDLENLVSARRQYKSVKAAGFCHQCGNPIHQQDRFCSRCGATV